MTEEQFKKRIEEIQKEQDVCRKVIEESIRCIEATKNGEELLVSMPLDVQYQVQEKMVNRFYELEGVKYRLKQKNMK